MTMTISTINVIVNGQPHTLAAGTTVAALIDSLGRPRVGLAVAVNARVVPRARWDDHPLAPADRIEILTATQGG